MLKKIFTMTLLLGFLLQMLAPALSAADLTTKYRVYHYQQIFKEYVSYEKAVAAARTMSYSHVEEISTRKWLWNNFPRYQIYQYNKTMPAWQFANLADAIKEAKHWGHASIRDLQSTGWVWHNYPAAASQYRLYQGEKTLDKWLFSTLSAAQNEAKKWGNAHIIDLNKNRWVWDNIASQKKAELRQGSPLYQVYVDTHTEEQWKFSYLEDAIAEAVKWQNSTVINIRTQKTVFSNTSVYQVLQNHRPLQGFNSINDAIGFAKKWAHASIETNGREIWNNSPYYQVFQNEKQIKEFTMIPSALRYAKLYSNASIRTYDGDILWDNKRKLLFWSWNGTSKPSTIQTQVSQTMGLDIASPTWFELTKPDGTMQDTSNASTVQWLKGQGIAVHPLIHNQFDSKLTSQFLASSKAQANFIQQVVTQAKALGVSGLNLDFESLNGKDRAEFTAFVQNFAKAAHELGLLFSIDLPRGSIDWNEQTAFDHAKLAVAVDYIMTMAYDQYYSGSPSPGSVSGLQWAEEGIQEFLSYGIPRDKLLLGIPFYSRLWKLNADGSLVGNRSLLMKDIQELLNTKQTTSVWDTQFQQYKVTYYEDGFAYVFWLEDHKSIQARLKLAQKYDLAGVAAWRLGHEQAEIWNTMIKEK